jgi:hypothetical protein
MKPLLQLNLQSNSEKAEAANRPKPEPEEPEPDVVRRLNRMANRVAHKAATEYGRNTSGIFSR